MQKNKIYYLLGRVENLQPVGQMRPAWIFVMARTKISYLS